MRHLPIKSIIVGVLLAASSAWSQVAERYQLREDFRLGLDLRHVVKAIERLPPFKRYFQLTLEEKALVRSFYTGMREADDPPYPDNGIGFYNAVMQLHARDLDVHGELALEVAVSAQGSTISIRVIRAPNDRMAALAVSGAKNMNFTPAQCESTPCALSFPIGLFLAGN